MRPSIALVVLLVAEASAGPRAVPVDGINIQHCIDSTAQAVAGRCPPYLVAAVKEAAQICTEVSGTPVGISPASVASLDVDGDGRSEFLYEIGANVGCTNAASIFSCGSLGCPQALVQEQKGAWVVIGGIGAFDASAVEVLPAGKTAKYRDLKVNCTDGDPPCSEAAYYQWSGQVYDQTSREVRGFKVDVAGSVHGLYGLLGDTALLATPSADGKVIGRYGSETDVAIIGQSADYYYVSPCNACESGFVRKAAVRKKF